jgi:hypothetical protein
MDMVDEADRRHAMRLRIAATVLLLLAALMFAGSFVAAAKTPTGYDLNSCRGPGPCDALPDSSNRQGVFFLGMASTLVLASGGMVLRSVANRDK